MHLSTVYTQTKVHDRLQFKKTIYEYLSIYYLFIYLSIYLSIFRRVRQGLYWLYREAVRGGGRPGPRDKQQHRVHVRDGGQHPAAAHQYRWEGREEEEKGVVERATQVATNLFPKQMN